jgi:hypothetical protein
VDGREEGGEGEDLVVGGKRRVCCVSSGSSFF